MSKLCVGLFGTCGESTWRDQFIERFTREGIIHYNPLVPNWAPECAVEEAEHLAEDDVIVFPVTSETYAMGSLSECGFSMLNAIRIDDRRDFTIMIDMELDKSLSDPGLRQESLRARALVYQHLKKLNLPNVYVVESLAEMLEVSVQLYRAAELRAPLRRYNPQNVK